MQLIYQKILYQLSLIGHYFISAYIGSSIFIILIDLIHLYRYNKTYYCIHGVSIKQHNNPGLYIGIIFCYNMYKKIEI